MSQGLTLAECLCARVCHDISNPLSALSGVLDLLRRQPTNQEAASIAEQAVRIAQERLRLFRAAWCSNDEAMNADEIRRLAEGLHTGARMMLDLSRLSGTFPPAVARAALNILLIGVESLNGHGSVIVNGTPHTGITIAIEGTHAAWPAFLADYLNDPQSAWNSLEPHGPVAPLAAVITSFSNLAIWLQPTDDALPRIVIAATPPTDKP